MYSTVAYPGRPAVTTRIIITRLQGAIQDDLSATGSKSISLTTSQGSTIINNMRSYNDTAYFTDEEGTANSGLWKRGPPEASNEPSLTLLPNPAVANCCVPGTNEFFITFSFTLYNPAEPQTPNNAVSIMATGIPIIQSAMREDISPRQPMHILKPEFKTSIIAQSDGAPCALNDITVSLQVNVNLYARCKPVIVLSGLSGLKESMFSNLTTKTVNSFHRHEIGISAVGAGNSGNAPANLNSVASWSNETQERSVLVINVTADEVTTSTILTFQFRVRNGPLPFVSLTSPVAVIQGIAMFNSTMIRPAEPKSRPLTIAKVGFEIASMGQQTP